MATVAVIMIDYALSILKRSHDRALSHQDSACASWFVQNLICCKLQTLELM